MRLRRLISIEQGTARSTNSISSAIFYWQTNKVRAGLAISGFQICGIHQESVP